MLQNLTRGLMLAASLLTALAAAGADPADSSAAARSPPTPVSEPLKVGFVYVSPVGEVGWSYQHDLGRRAMEHALGARVRSTVVESVAEGADSERVIRDLARQGHRLVFATSFG